MTPTHPTATIAIATLALLGSAGSASAQTIGTFRWQLQPYCNVVTLTVTQQGANYQLDGFDDQCGGPQRAPVVGMGTANPDGSIGFGLHVVTVPGGRGLQIDARITVPALGGSWSDSTGASGTFAFGANTAGSARPAPSGPGLPAPFSFLNDGGFAARGTGGSGAIPATGSGVRMMWYPQEAAFRAGGVQGRQWDPGNVGFGSAAFGGDTSASGQYGFAAGNASAAIGPFSTALGLHAVASGYGATAIGQDTTASGIDSLAVGQNTTASGPLSLAGGYGTGASGAYSVVFGTNVSRALGIASLAAGSNAVASGDFSRSLGFDTVSSGVSSTAIGVGTQAAGDASVALGTFASTAVAGSGSFVFGDRSTVGGGGGGRVTASGPNQFLVRAAGGTTFYSNAALTAGVSLFAGAGSWSNVSDVNMKERFRDLDGEDVLTRLARMPVREWSYKAQDAAIRHLGPTAQDFRAAFGLGESDVRISTVDADGVALAAARALETRTTGLRDEMATLRRENDDLRARLARVEQRLLELAAASSRPPR